MDGYQDGEAKVNFVKQLEAAREMLTRIDGGEFLSQEVVDQMTKALRSAIEALSENGQTPVVDKSKLFEAIAKAENLKLSDYQEEGKAEFA